MNTSSVSAPVVVKVQATSRLRPSTTKGTPGAVAPASTEPGVSIRTRYQMPGKLNAKCGSPASNGAPVALCAPSTAQELEALPDWVNGPGKRGSSTTQRSANASWPGPGPEPGPASGPASAKRGAGRLASGLPAAVSGGHSVSIIHCGTFPASASRDNSVRQLAESHSPIVSPHS